MFPVYSRTELISADVGKSHIDGYAAYPSIERSFAAISESIYLGEHLENGIVHQILGLIPPPVKVPL